MEEKPEDGSFDDVKVSLKSLDGSGGSDDYYGSTLMSWLVAGAGAAILMV
jgi:hypothetical protein